MNINKATRVGITEEQFFGKCGCSYVRITIPNEGMGGREPIVVVDRIGAGVHHCPLGHDSLGAKLVKGSRRRSK